MQHSELTQTVAYGSLIVLARVILDPLEVWVAVKLNPAIGECSLALKPQADLAVSQ